MISVERINAIAEAIGTDEAEARKAIDMSPTEAAEYFKAKGFEVTAEELVEFATYVKDNLSGNGEIDENDLENVSGGSVTAAVFVAGVIVGMIMNRRNVW